MALQSTTALASVTLQAAASEVVFSGIPNTYRDLIVVVAAAPTVSVVSGAVQVNSDTGSNYNMVGMRGNGSGAAGYSTSTTNMWFDYAGDTSSGTTSVAVMSFYDYSSNDKHKTVLTRQGNSADVVEALAQRWASTSPVTSLRFFWTSGSIAAGSTFNLYGVIA
jgi:hypothetical protein